MGMIVHFGIMCRMFMLMGAMLTHVFMVVLMDVCHMRMGMTMLMDMFMLMDVSMFVRMNHLAVAMLMIMPVCMLMIMQMPMFVDSLHFVLLPS
ncbi:hypothetical protein [Desulfobacca acetoxidans]|uniref:Uncharacterized protein n=1 Tax=Desulfobacca acetoxidans (strain ATCC 700848 / DSM 11109 / ASRB2) TaxID=880072 RepID=F2NDX0_DESAR|nr:hypothetical protein [Desulfobacca acetoxidans]AEB10538.1 hypothetical protein Desac_2724 [Desulfobacca acetoxidans DSM 11109]